MKKYGSCCNIYILAEKISLYSYLIISLRYHPRYLVAEWKGKKFILGGSTGGWKDGS